MYRDYEESGETPDDSPLVTGESDPVVMARALADKIMADCIRQRFAA